ncbi:MAG TPA: hypothetical protein VLJ68_06035 [Chitinophagaceae bacterium]|nr:hypothetical protein [Chitinophagaceae bacterium]
MEVHAHTHTARKKWTHYFWEFLMLFLAVFCGFLAENFREHQVEKRREHQFILSLIDDVKLDTTALKGILTRRVRRKEMFDSLSLLLNGSQRDNYVSRLYFLSRQMQRLSPVIFTYNDRTIQQLKNGGNMRLISKQNVTDAVVLYDAAVREMYTTQERENDYMLLSLPHIYRIFDGQVMDLMLDSAGAIHEPPFNVRLLPGAQTSINDFNGVLHSLKGSNIILITKVRTMIAEGEKLLNTLKKEYHLD